VPAIAQVKVNLRGDDVVRRIMQDAPDILRDVMVGEVTNQTLALLDRVRRKAGGDVIGVKTGKLLASIKPQVRASKNQVRGKVRASGTKYFGVVNFGGRLQARDIRPTKARALHMLATSAELFAAIVRHPAYEVGRHEVMYSSLDELRAGAVEALRAAVGMAAERAAHG
jgi:hypothetical protein